MNLVSLYLACILAGFALTKLPDVGFLTGLGGFFNIIAALAMIVFSFALLYLGAKALFKK